MYVEYDSNNSGGSWWLEDSHWRALEAAGWKVQWAHLEKKYTAKGYERDADGTPLLVPIGNSNCGGPATRAFRVGLGLREAADEWERITGMDATAAGCACCGQPHTFTEYDDAGKFARCGPSTSYEAHW